MEQITTFRQYRMPNKQYLAFMTEISAQIKKATPEKLHLDTVYPDFVASIAHLNATLSINRSSIHTAELSKLDKHRLSTWRAIRGRLKYTLFSPFEEEKEAAKYLLRTFKKHGNVSQKSLTGKSAGLHHITSKLQSDEFSGYVKKLGIEHWISALKEQNKAFQELTNDRIREQVAKAIGTVTEARAITDRQYTEIVNRVNASLTLGMAGNETTKFVSRVNLSIKKELRLQAWRRSMRAGKKRREAERLDTTPNNADSD